MTGQETKKMKPVLLIVEEALKPIEIVVNRVTSDGFWYTKFRFETSIL